MFSYQVVFQNEDLTAISLFHDKTELETYAFAGFLSDVQIRDCMQAIIDHRPGKGEPIRKRESNVFKFEKQEMQNLLSPDRDRVIAIDPGVISTDPGPVKPGPIKGVVELGTIADLEND